MESGLAAPSSNFEIQSEYLANRLLNFSENLYSFVKFNCVAELLRGVDKPRVLDLGCASKEGEKYFNKFSLSCAYFGVDYEGVLHPDAVCDIRYIDQNQSILPWRPDVVLLLDVLEHLEGREDDILQTLAATAAVLAERGSVVIVVPQMYRLDRFKLKHLFYAEHKVRFNREEWLELISQHFSVENVRGIGFLSTVPYLVMFLPWYKEQNLLGALFRFLRNRVFEWNVLKKIDVFLTKYLGHLPCFVGLTNGVLIVASPKERRRG
jgi:SAM-dependent methyltransferase